MARIIDLPTEILLQIFREVQRDGTNDCYPILLLNAAAACQRFFDVTFEIYWQWDEKRWLSLVKKSPMIDWRKISYGVWKGHVEEESRL